jgi:hypothetical protein
VTNRRDFLLQSAAAAVVATPFTFASLVPSREPKAIPDSMDFVNAELRPYLRGSDGQLEYDTSVTIRLAVLWIWRRE